MSIIDLVDQTSKEEDMLDVDPTKEEQVKEAKWGDTKEQAANQRMQLIEEIERKMATVTDWVIPAAKV